MIIIRIFSGPKAGQERPIKMRRLEEVYWDQALTILERDQDPEESSLSMSA